ncbi:MAG: DUF3524 domain-containing protein [Planctomycetota bacterium]
MKSRSNVVLFEPWYGGSHRAFADAWARRSRNRVGVIGLAPRHWKWRQEASAWELAARVEDLEVPDVVGCSDYVDLPRLMGFLPEAWRALPTLCYFHENQLTYPRPGGGTAERDLTHAFSNVLTAVRADAVVFNSEFHRAEFADAADAWLRTLPRPNPRAELARALERATVVPPLPELEAVPLGPGAPDGAPLRVAFPHRLEDDKDPLAFLSAVRRALDAGARLELALFGGTPEAAAPEVRAALEGLGDVVGRSGFVDAREEYLVGLGRCDVVASTAHHEFFGVAFAEAMAAGCAPLALDRANYRSLVGPTGAAVDGAGIAADAEDLVQRLVGLAASPQGARAAAPRAAARDAALRFDAGGAVESLDGVVEALPEPGPER